MPTMRSLQALTDRLKRQLERDAAKTPELAQYPGFVFGNDDGTIDDGDYGDPLRDTRPEWLRNTEDAGWQPISSRGR